MDGSKSSWTLTDRTWGEATVTENFLSCRDATDEATKRYFVFLMKNKESQPCTSCHSVATWKVSRLIPFSTNRCACNEHLGAVVSSYGLNPVLLRIERLGVDGGKT